MRLQIQFKFSDHRLLIALIIQLGYHACDRHDTGLIETKVFDDAIINVLHDYKEFMVGFIIDKEMKMSTIKYTSYEKSEGEDEYLEVWISAYQLDEILN